MWVSTKGAPKAMEKQTSLLGVVGKFITVNRSDLLWREKIGLGTPSQDVFQSFAHLIKLYFTNLQVSSLWCVLTVAGPYWWPWHHLFMR